MFKLKFCTIWARKCLNQASIAPYLTLTRSLNTDNLYSERGNTRRFRQDPKPTFTESEPEFLVKAKLDPDTFGEGAVEPELLDEGDIREEKFFTEQPAPGSRLSTKKYADIIKQLIRKRRIKEAIDVLEIRMLKQDRAKPENYIYNLLLGACGRVGYTKKAFMLYNDMKKRGLKAHPGTYTALFNACANSPWPTTDGLTRAKDLYNIMIEKGDQPNDTNYNAMIKAFGRCGDLSMAFSLVDQMENNGIPIKGDTVNFLLQSCISDSEAGFRHSLLVWRKLIEKNISPNSFSFNLLLRCVRDCNLGDLETTNEVIGMLVGDTDKHKLLQADHLQLGDDSEDSSNTSLMAADTNQRPNLLADKPHLGNILAISEVKTPEDRLLLLGGCSGFLDTMFHHKCTPNIKTFSLLLDCIPNTLAAEKELLVALRKVNIKPDLDFYNILMKKRCMRCDYESARAVLMTIKQAKMHPNIMTYGVLAMGCQTKEEADDLLKEMSAIGYTLNASILGAMLRQACHHSNFQYIFSIMELCLEQSVSVGEKFLHHLSEFKRKCRRMRDNKEMTKKQVEQFKVFNERYKTWLTEVQVDESEEAHPWQQFRQDMPEHDLFKGKDAARFKPRHLTRFKVRTSKKHSNKAF